VSNSISLKPYEKKGNQQREGAQSKAPIMTFEKKSQRLVNVKEEKLGPLSVP